LHAQTPIVNLPPLCPPRSPDGFTIARLRKL
jgi:hypothetical protein